MATRPCPSCGGPISYGYQQAGPKYCSEGCKPRCSVEGCDSPRRKRGWCASHYAQWQRTGVEPVPFAWKWAERQPCLVCGEAVEKPAHRRFCTDACRVLWETYDGVPPTSTPCVACGVEIDLTERGKGGQRRKVTTKFCRPCRQDYRKYKLSARQLAQRDGTACGICGEEVDMTLRRSESGMCPSVDHIVPRSWGGTHDPDNLQLAHLRCNQVKSDRWAGIKPAQLRGQQDVLVLAEVGD